MELRKSSSYDAFETNFEKDFIIVGQIDQPDDKVQSNFTDEVWCNFGELAIKYKFGVRLFSFFTSEAQDIWRVPHSVYCGFKQ